ncbi:response regulator [Reichenbachiella versicolor]|uniref:response regulator n=1 Tax=Reichenbachiella versicolor TaxID=1821036 RepID=UPI000D6DDA6E|nr:response regulator [Reichenbachiella versicolor]
MKLLIVDDSSMMRTTIESHLNNFGFEIVGHAGNGREALELVTAKRPDFVTLDITMPEMDGIECLEEIMKIAPDTKVMIITALSDKYTGLEALKKGAREFLYKPVTPEQLKEGFDSMISHH